MEVLDLEDLADSADRVVRENNQMQVEDENLFPVVVVVYRNSGKIDSIPLHEFPITWSWRSNGLNDGLKQYELLEVFEEPCKCAEHKELAIQDLERIGAKTEATKIIVLVVSSWLTALLSIALFWYVLQ